MNLREKKFMGWPVLAVIGGVLIYCGALGLLITGTNALVERRDAQEVVRYEYRLVTPADAIHMVNDEGWRVSERIQMTSEAVYIYRARQP